MSAAAPAGPAVSPVVAAALLRVSTLYDAAVTFAGNALCVYFYDLDERKLHDHPA